MWLQYSTVTNEFDISISCSGGTVLMRVALLRELYCRLYSKRLFLLNTANIVFSYRLSLF